MCVRIEIEGHDRGGGGSSSYIHLSFQELDFKLFFLTKSVT